jgi:ribosome biogenesis protein ENP2
VLGDDYTKLAFLQDDRHVELHAGYGKHHRTRIPTFGRDMAFHGPTAELLVGAAGSDVYRLSLEEGRFMAPLRAGSAGVNRVAVSRVTALVATGCDGGLVQLWDPREYATPAAALRVAGPGGGGGGGGECDVTALAFDERSLTLGLGTSDGRAQLFDLRSARAPLVTKTHQYGTPVVRLAFHRGAQGGDVVLSADARQVKLWRRADGGALASIEVPAGGTLRDVAIASD